MSGLFITATGTEVGKTVVTAALTWQLQQDGQNVTALKPVISGYEDNAENDTSILLGLQPGKSLDDISPWRFREPLSPNIAAAKEGRAIDPTALIDFCRAGIGADDLTLIEGIGGSHVPLAKRFLVVDWISALEIPAVVVTGSYLGSLSDTLSTLEALAARGIALQGVVISESDEPAMALAETKVALAEQMPDTNITILNRIQKLPLWQHAEDLTGLVKNL